MGSMSLEKGGEGGVGFGLIAAWYGTERLEHWTEKRKAAKNGTLCKPLDCLSLASPAKGNREAGRCILEF